MFEFLFKYSRDYYARSELVYLGQWPGWVLYSLVAVVGVAIIAFLWRRHGAARTPLLIVIGTLQFAMLGVVVWVLLEPALRTEKLRDGENSVALLLDTSASMAYGPGQSRLLQAQQSLDAALDGSDAPRLSMQRYEFSAGVRSVESFAAAMPAGSRTSLAGSLSAVLREARFGPLAAVILSSDGADTSGSISVEELAEIAGFGVPVHSIGVGRERIPEDLELTDVLLPGRALPGSTVSARVSVRHDDGGTTRIKVYDGDRLLASKALQLRADAGTSTAWIDIDLADAGHRQLTFSLEPRVGEQELRNNSQTKLIEVAEQEYQILYFEGEPRWEYKFLRRAVSQNRDLNIVSLLRVSPNKFYRQGLASPEQLQHGFPQSRDELFAYDALIIGSVEAASLTAGQQQLIRDFVSERGGGLLMLAGPNGLGNGGWGQSEIAAVLPARLPASGRNSFYRKQVPVALTPQGNDTQMLRLAGSAKANRQAWSELPALADYQLIGAMKPAAVALLTVRTEFGELPLLVRQNYGRGTSYILASGGTWRWQMSLPLDDQRHETVWRQLLRAMVGSAPARVSLTAEAGPGRSDILLRAEFRDESFRPVDEIEVTAVVSHEDGAADNIHLAPSAEEPGVYHGKFTPVTSGTHFVEAVATRNNEPLQTVRRTFYHEVEQAEHFGFRKNRPLLQRLSEATGGQYMETANIAALPDLLRYSSSGVTEQEYATVWDAPAVFLLLILLKAGEWLLRRRWSTI